MVEGASPEMLRELLDRYERLLASNGFQVQWLGPGASRRAIDEALGNAGLTLPEELYVWYGWHNGGFKDGERVWIDAIPGSTWYSAEESSVKYEKYRPYFGIPHEQGGWDPRWIPISPFSGIGGIAVESTSGSIPPRVRFIDQTVDDVENSSLERQVVSLCTPVAWWLDAIEAGEYRIQEAAIAPVAGLPWGSYRQRTMLV